MKKRLVSRKITTNSGGRFYLKEGVWHKTNGCVFSQCRLSGHILYYHAKRCDVKLTCYYDPILAKETCKYLNRTKPTVYVPWMLLKKVKMK